MPDCDPITSMTMIEKARSGNEDAWKRLISIYGPLVHVQCIRKGLQIADAKDVTMEVFKSVFTSLSQFSRDQESFRFLRYLRTIATRRIADHLRKEGRRKDKAAGGEEDWFHDVPQINAPEDDPEEETIMETLWSIENVLTDLEAQIWSNAKRKYGKRNTFRAFEMSEVQGMKAADIAATLNITETAVRTYVSRVQDWIKLQVQQLPGTATDAPDDDVNK